MKRLSIISSLLVLAFLVPAAIAGQVVPASDNPNLRYLPNQWSFIINLDMKTVNGFMHEAFKEAPQEAMMNAYRQQLKLLTGIDWRELNEVTMFVSGDPEASPAVLAVIRGRFDRISVGKHFAGTFGDGAKEVKTDNGNAMVKDDMAYIFPEDGLLLIGDPKSVIAAANAPVNSHIPANLKKLLDHTPADALVWVTGNAKAMLHTASLADWRKENAELAEHLGKIEFASLFFQPADDGLLVNIVGRVDGAAEAAKLSVYLNERRTALLTREGSNIFGFFALHIARVDAEEDRVSLKFQVTGDALEKLWKARVILKPHAHPNPER